MQEVMIIRNDGLKLFQVDDSTIAKLTRIRGNLYRDDPRLRTVADMPTMTQSQTPEMSPEMARREAAAYQDYLVKRAGTTVTPEPPKPVLTFEEQLAHDWRHSPSLRREFTSFGSYQAYMRAAEAGRCRAYGKV